jgi:hypothetical protein
MLVGRSKGIYIILNFNFAHLDLRVKVFALFFLCRARQIRPIIVDPGLYLSSRTDVFYATQKRELPSAYKLFTGEVNAF